MKQHLPIDAYLKPIFDLVEKSSTILIKASPGSGKTTRVPWYLARHLPGKVLVLEPRRIAAKLAAERISSEEGFRTGQEVGYHFRFDKNHTPDSKLIFYTEGTFLRKLLQDSGLHGVDVVILDEFHERHLETDMALAYLRQLQLKKPALKIILMSATLDTQSIPEAASIEVEAPNFPVTVHYLPNQPSVLNQNLEVKIRSALEKIAANGDVLIFLPGMREILRVKDYLGDRYGEVHILHSEVSKEEQEQALIKQSRRKIILSTNIAESSVTIPGIVAVIDSGLQREAVYSPWNGLKVITDRPVTKASAIQRAGRAGRTAPGECHRLYSLQDFESREAYTQPEILRADLTDVFLLAQELKTQLKWMTPPAPERWLKAQELCQSMGILQDEKLRSKISHYPLDTRLSRVLVAGEQLNKSGRKKLLNYICSEIENDQSGRLLRRLSFYLERESGQDLPWEQCLLAGFVDQTAKFRSKQHDFIHYSGKTIRPHPSLSQLTEGYYLILNITQRQEAIQTVPLEEEWLFELEPFPFSEQTQLSVDERFELRSQTRLGSIVIDEKNLPLDWSGLNPEQQNKLLEVGARPFEKRWELWKESELYNRFLYWSKLKNKELNQNVSLKDYLNFSGQLNWEQLDYYFQQALEIPALDNELPLQINLGGKKQLKIHYPFNGDPYIEAPIQEFYGLKDTPRISGMPVTLKLVGPHKRPLQVTKDLAGFWKKTYQEMKKEFQREYPRHHWPEDPANAPPLLLKRHLQPS